MVSGMDASRMECTAGASSSCFSVSALGGVDSEDSWWGVAAGAPHTLKSEHTGVPNRLRPVPKAAHCPCRCMHRASHLDVSSAWLPGLMSMRCITCLLWHACVCSIVVFSRRTAKVS